MNILQTTVYRDPVNVLDIFYNLKKHKFCCTQSRPFSAIICILFGGVETGTVNRRQQERLGATKVGCRRKAAMKSRWEGQQGLLLTGV